MNPKSITRIVLLAVVALAIGGWAIQQFGSTGTAASTAATDDPATAFTRPDGITVINFHGERRCRTCIHIGKLAEKTLHGHFSAALESGDVRWEHINYEANGNTHYVTDYELVSSTIVATCWKDGKEVKWTRLDGVWDHLNDEATFDAYLASGIQELMNLP
ncbi:MAG: nitrophenyl compound nitroreductase subunit ArsF family protein [Luteolibacter sp.]|jgi:hypothetical protein